MHVQDLLVDHLLQVYVGALLFASTFVLLMFLINSTGAPMRCTVCEDRIAEGDLCSACEANLDQPLFRQEVGGRHFNPEVEARTGSPKATQQLCARRAVNPDAERLIPFDTFNMLYRDELEETRLGPIREWITR